MSNQETIGDNLLSTLMRLALLRQDVADSVALNDAILVARRERHVQDDLVLLSAISDGMGFGPVRRASMPSLSAVPALVRFSGSGWALLRGQNSLNQWVLEIFENESLEWRELVLEDHKSFQCFHFSTRRPDEHPSVSIRSLVVAGLMSHKKALRDLIIGGVTINLIAIVTSFYSMQVYDRVVPTGASSTLLVLTIGVCLSILLELLVKHVRTTIFTRLVSEIDATLAQTVYKRFLSLRMDQLPHTVGGLASQLRGYESVRSLLASTAGQLLTDFPFVAIFAVFIFLIGGKLVLIPVVFLVVAVVLGAYASKSSMRLARLGYRAANEKTGLLVETVEGAETIKSGQGGWRMLARWLQITSDARESDLAMKQSMDSFQHVAAAIHQLSFVLAIAAGALVVGQGELTLGGLIAISILSGRMLSSIAVIPGFINQLSQTIVALDGIDKLWKLRDDHDGISKPVVLSAVQGRYKLANVEYGYAGKLGLKCSSLEIDAGEKVGIIGPIGSGKTTLLRLLSGMYKPQIGKVLLDDVDISHLSKPVLSDHIAFVAQDARLFSGTLKDNLILGMIDPGDRVILEVAQKTGLFDTVVSRHSKGLYQEIFEGGTGLSGGQRQLVHFTRAFLRSPSVWLLDEPTVSMDSFSEKTCLDALRNAIETTDTVVLVTHKPELMGLVDRLIVVARNQVVLQGPRDLILGQLKSRGFPQAQGTLSSS